MKQINSVTKKHPTKLHSSYDDDDSMLSESIYTDGADSVRKLESDADDSDSNSFTSSITNSGIFPEPRAKVNSSMYDDMENKTNHSKGLDRRSEHHDIENNLNATELGPPEQRRRDEVVSETLAPHSASSSSDTSEELDGRKSPLAWYKNSSRRFKFAFFATLALFLAFLVLLILLLVSGGIDQWRLPSSTNGSGVESKNNKTLDGNKATEPNMGSEPIEADTVNVSRRANPMH